ncbi:uncharacterized protein CANTADRAFT_339401 [Suhomyces tanzawaensis NRRL Y-17324]|uniref:Uncharacterized protein n=1 Tax=Suhomyces tanzawaensis NRRL Y-17324 TaxID=984487 RepID=A0A1E4SKN2_9ASCO|nr:uncharacterized protein CANTADRAFT_339401 [Suhomyces tanzawaensis NRRL Y-17324]ODV80066.1 hypothetical protein CANTADRAFT_339401 [Suhomyces tanzawaensis NRRL Y-17324]
MDDTDKPDPILKQVPLVKNPSFQPPKPVTLKTNYAKLIPTLSKSSVPPKINLSEDDLRKWLNEIQALKAKVANLEDPSDLDVQKYEEWVQLQQAKVAPGFYSFEGVMQPSKREIVPEKVVLEDQEVNELDKVFGKSTI